MKRVPNRFREGAGGFRENGKLQRLKGVGGGKR